MKAFWLVGVILQLIGLTALPVGLFVGVYGDDLGMEWMIAAIGLIIFFAGTGIRSWAGGGS